MAPSTAQICSQLRQVIWYHIDNDLLDNAVFLAGRLHAIDPRNADSVHLLALCYFRLREFKAAYDHCRTLALKREHPGCSYVFAQACLGLGRHSEGAAALERARTLWEGKDTLGRDYVCACSRALFSPTANTKCCRETHRYPKTAVARCRSFPLSAREARTRHRRYQARSGMLCLGTEVESVHVGCVRATLRHWYGESLPGVLRILTLF